MSDQTLQTIPLTPAFGVEVQNVQLADAREDHHFPEIRALFEEHSALLFRAQEITDEDHIRLAKLFGPLENRNADNLKADASFEVPKVSNVREDGSVSGEMDLHTLNLKSNMHWHADSTFLPVPALANILIGRIVTTEGGATELASTRAAWAAMPQDLKARIRGRAISHHYRHSRHRISPELAKLPMFNKWPEQRWDSVLTNPVNGAEALYIASHAFAVDGYGPDEAQALLDALTEFCTRPEFTYSHQWQVGDVLIWDQRAVLHRGTPWPYEQPRTLSSICVSITEADGLSDMRPAN